MPTTPQPLLTQAVFLIGGRGTRLGALTRNTPKPLIETAGRPFIEHLMDHAARHGVRDILLLAGYHGAQAYEAYHERDWRGARVRVIVEPEPAGTGGALSHAAAHLHDTFLMANGDSFLDCNLLALAAGLHRAPNAMGALALAHVPDASRFGSVILKDGRVTGYAEKRPDAAGRPGLISSGTYLLRKGILDHLTPLPCSIEYDVFPRLVEAGRILGQRFNGYFIDMGTPESLEQARQELPGVLTRPAVFFDRDGVLNVDDGYTHRPEDLVWIDGAIDAVRKANDAGYYAFVVTNQAGVAKGHYDCTAVEAFHAHMQAELACHGAHIDAFYYCPYHPDGVVPEYAAPSHNRKPNPGMLERAARDWPVDRTQSFLIGDKDTDLAAAAAFGIPGHLFSGGNVCDVVTGAMEGVVTEGETCYSVAEA